MARKKGQKEDIKKGWRCEEKASLRTSGKSSQSVSKSCDRIKIKCETGTTEW